MNQLEPADLHHLNAAAGWLGLNCPADARAELDGLGPRLQKHPAVLETRWLICAHEKDWSAALEIARTELAAAPEDCSGWLHQAYALRRMPGCGLRQAKEALLPAIQKFPDEPVVAYNLACYACQLGDLTGAREWLAKSVESGGKKQIKGMALADEDLKPLWQEIESW